LMDTNVEVYCVHPGGINTNIYRNAVHYERDPSLDEKFQKMLERTSPEQAAKIILKGVEKKNEKILIGIDAEIIDRLARTMPVAYTTIAKKVFDYTSK
jgi:short-subunit dehydrogenase